MGVCRSAMLVALLALFPICTLAVDYPVDPTFNPTFQFSDFNDDKAISDIVTLPDGKVLISGTFRNANGAPALFLVRLNSVLVGQRNGECRELGNDGGHSRAVQQQ